MIIKILIYNAFFHCQEKIFHFFNQAIALSYPPWPRQEYERTRPNFNEPLSAA